MKSKERYERYAKAEVELAKLYLAKNPDDTAQRDRLAYWSAVLGDHETAVANASTDKCRGLVDNIINAVSD